MRKTAMAGVLGTNDPQARWFLKELDSPTVACAFGDSGLGLSEVPGLSERRDIVRDRSRWCWP